MGQSFGEMFGVKELTSDKSMWKALIAEFIGTLILIFFGIGCGLNWDGNEGASVVHISLAVGFTVASLVQTFGHISGCHINPSVTVGFLVAGKIKPIKAILYILVQCLGGIVGTALLRASIPIAIHGNVGTTIPNPNITPLQAIGAEFLMTFVLVMTIFGVCDENRNDVKGSAPLAIGIAAAASHLAGIKFTGASLNPARSLGPAVFTHIWTYHYVYWFGPLAGGATAGLLYNILFKAPPKRAEPKMEHNYELCSINERKEID